jgi:large subunit ribosomal protein L25
MKDILNIKAEKRDVFGKKLAESRKNGLMPAVFYGPKDKAQPVFVSLADFKKVYQDAGESTIIKIDYGGKKKDALIQEVDFDPVKGEPRHADFFAVDMTKEITATVPLEFVGSSPAVKGGAVLVTVMHEVEVESMPDVLPSEIVVDISVLKNPEDKITVADLKIAEGVKINADSEDVVVFAELPKEEIIEESRTIADIEVISAKKDEESEESGEAGEKGGAEK